MVSHERRDVGADEVTQRQESASETTSIHMPPIHADTTIAPALSAEEASPDGPLYATIKAHHEWTGSLLAAEVLRYWPHYARFRFDKVVSVVPRADVGDD